MTISRETVRHVAALARLEFTEAEEEQLAAQLGQILDYVNQLAELDTEGLEPTSHSIPLTNVVRPDVRRPSLPRDELLAAAPQVEGGMFRVPRILSD